MTLREERAKLWDAFMEDGGRGVELAEEIDRLDREIARSARAEAYAEGFTFAPLPGCKCSICVAARDAAHSQHMRLRPPLS